MWFSRRPSCVGIALAFAPSGVGSHEIRQGVLWVLAFISGGLAIAADASDLEQSFRKWRAKAGAEKNLRRAQEKLQQDFRDYVPYLNDKERQILGYLRKKKLKTFTAEIDGGYASTLLSRGFIKIIAVHNQRFDEDKGPMAVPEHVWRVIEEGPGEFPYKPEYSEDRPKVEVDPWHIPWMVR